MKQAEDIKDRAKALFAFSSNIPTVTLRGGNAMDDYKESPPFDPVIDQATDDYLLKYHWGLNFLDPISWQYYLPVFIDYSLRHIGDRGNIVVDAFFSSLRPPDREPRRFAPLSKEQQRVIIDFLDCLAFDDTSEFKEYAMQVLEEFWIPGSLYRK